MKAISRTIALVLVFGVAALAQHPHHAESDAMNQPVPPTTTAHPSHAGAAAVSYAELKNTVALLERARQATAKYQDVHVAEAEGYQPLGGDHPGMGIHYVLTLEPKAFDIEKPPVLLYVKNSDGAYTLVGVGYLLNSAEGPDGQPIDPPFPKALASWHRHDNICMLAGLQNPGALSESECRAKGGQFVAKSQWLVHAWIWKDNPAGVFTSDNPTLRSGKTM